MIAVWLIRHGESESNVGLPTTKPTEFTQLTSRGHKQAQAVATVVPTPDLIITSPYVRAKQTAQPAIAQFPSCPQVEWQVQEFDYLASPPSVSSHAEILQLCKAYWQRRDPFYRDGGEAESFANLMQRVVELFEQLRQLEGKTVLVFSHSGFIRAVLWASLMQPLEITPKTMDRFCNFIQALRIPNGAIVKLHLHEQDVFFSPILTAHLEGL
ncbi:MAG: histidine phosphatase family protein [Leptolyngbyaceae cyanobacterium bins.302]|nr:histidine phosphatase family protein [Leptolyngbyaceae cyanobacterium bins.302]